MARVCPHCGAGLPEATVDVCTECWEPIDEGTALPLPDSNPVVRMARMCPHCGAGLPGATVDVCTECWEPIDEGTAPALPDPNAVVSIIHERGQPEQHRIGVAIACLSISEGMYVVLVALLCLLLPTLKGFGIRLAICLIFFCLAIIVGIDQVVSGLRRRKFWAWVTGIIIFGTYLPSLFLPLGVLGLWGLLDKGSQTSFGIGRDRRRS